MPADIDHEVEKLLEAVRLKYEKAGLADDWVAERGPLVGILRELVQELAGVLTLVAPLGVGGAGLVFLVRDERLFSPDSAAVHSVLKLPRPVSGRVAQINEILQRETDRLRGLRHDNLIRIQLVGLLPESRTPYFAMEAMAEPSDADEWLASHPQLTEVVRIILGASRGLAQLHSQDPAIAHLDVKPSNLFVNATSVVVADLGFAKRVGGSGHTTGVGGTRGYMHPDLEKLLVGHGRSGLDDSDSNRLMQTRPIDRASLKKEWDLYSLGVTVLVLLRVIELADSDSRDYSFRYLKLMAYRMLGDEVGHATSATASIRVPNQGDIPWAPLVEKEYLGLNESAFRELGYRSIHEVLVDLQKLTGEVDLLRVVPELQEFPREVIQAASHGSAPFSDRIAEIVGTPEVRALSRVDQLGLVRLVYPGATHSRLEHSLGTLAMAAQFTRALYSDPVSPLFKQLMDARDLELLLVVCLLHDIGHYPLAHDLEEVDTAFSHERRTRYFLERSEEIRVALSSGKWSPGLLEKVRRVLGDVKESDLSVQEMLVKSVVDGPVDADKLDYLIRDSENLRLPYGRGVDVRKLLQSLTVIVKSGVTRKDRGTVFARIGITDKGRIAAESVAFARYSLYGSVYWHRTHRTLKAMLNRLGLEAVAQFRASLTPAKRKELTKQLQAALYRYLDKQSAEAATLKFDDEHMHTEDSGPYFDAHTEQMVWWLATLAKGSGSRQLAIDILARRKYDRIFVLTRSRKDFPAESWKRVDGIFGEIGKKWNYRRDFMHRLEHLVAEDLQSRLRTDPKNPLDAQMRALLNEIKRGTPVLLVDFPPRKTGSPRELEYLREDPSRIGASDPFDVANIEDSTMWAKISGAYSLNLGKLRVYCHPDWSSLVAELYPHSEMRDLLSEALESTTGEMEAELQLGEGGSE